MKMDIDQIIEEIKKKKELSHISDSFVKDVLQSELNKTPLPEKHSKKQLKLIVKIVRAKLRLSVGRFDASTNKASLSEIHISTKERLPHYEWLKLKISSLKPESILDLGCGLNPIIIASQKFLYYACDINESNIKKVKEHFSKEGIKGDAFVADVTKLPELPEVDLVLALKLFDIIDFKGRKNVENIISNLSYKNFIASFPTIKISGRKMNRPKRLWFEKMLNRLGYSFGTEEISNEIFYTFNKNSS